MPVTLLALVLVCAGCSAQTGMVLEVSSTQSSLAAGIETVVFVTSRASWCDRLIGDEGASGTRVAVGTRELRDRPYELYVQPTHFTDLSAPLHGWAFGLNAAGSLVAVADFGEHPFEYKSVNRYRGLFAAYAKGDAKYITDDGCVCAPGIPRIGNGSGTGCDLEVVTSPARLLDTAGCELGADQHQLERPVCDGQNYGDAADRVSPCFAKRGSDGCSVAARTCHDRDSVGWTGACTPEANAPILPSTALCDAYATCAQDVCGDVDGCFVSTAPRGAEIHCHLFVTVNGQLCDPTATSPLPTTATGAECVAVLLGGAKHGSLTLALTGTGPTQATISCPPMLGVTAIDSNATTPTTLDVALGDKLSKVTISTVVGCPADAGAFSCQ